VITFAAELIIMYNGKQPILTYSFFESVHSPSGEKS